MNLMNVAIVIGLAFGPLAACMAFVITYQEYKRHYPRTSKVPLKHGLKSAAVALIVCAIVTFIAGFFIPLVMRR
jgi:xanthine/uracil permease